jgi:hypothetical protein
MLGEVECERKEKERNNERKKERDQIRAVKRRRLVCLFLCARSSERDMIISDFLLC